MGTQELGFRSLHEEVGPVDLAVTGRIPPWLRGALVRTGPALFEVGSSSYRHWFDGLAMLYRFGFGGGGVRYASRFVRSRGYEAARTEQRIAHGEFATAPDRGVLGRIGALFRASEPSDNANVNVLIRRDGAFALTETPRPVAFDPATLETLGPTPFTDGLNGQVTTAHPHIDARRGVQVNYLLEFGRRSCIHVLEQPLDGRERRLLASVPVDRPAYMHSFGLTDRYVVLVEPPLRVHPLRMRFSTRPFIARYRWQRGEGTRFRLVDRSDGSVTTVEGESCFAFHQVNAFDDGDDVTIDLCAYPDAAIVDNLSLDRLRGPGTSGVARSRLLRYRLPRTGGTARVEEISPEPAELPRIHEGASAGRRYASLWAASTRSAESGFFDRINRIDVENGSRAAKWEQDGCYAGEPLFIPRPGGSSEADGAVVSLILDSVAQRSALLVLDAKDLVELARAELPHIVPFNFHGRHTSGAEPADTVA